MCFKLFQTNALSATGTVTMLEIVAKVTDATDVMALVCYDN